MQKQLLGAMGAAISVLASTIVLAGPATAAQDGSTQWVMPAVKGSILQPALNAIYSVTGTQDIDLRIVNTSNNQQVINLTNWEVCSQSPAGGRTISPKSKRVTLYVRRPNTSGCSA